MPSWLKQNIPNWGAVSNTMDSALTSQALENAMRNCQKLPEIFNTDQGSQFTSLEWVGKLEGLGIKVSMDGKGRWMDNVFIERLWRTLKYEDVYLKEYGTLCDMRRILTSVLLLVGLEGNLRRRTFVQGLSVKRLLEQMSHLLEGMGEKGNLRKP